MPRRNKPQRKARNGKFTRSRGDTAPAVDRGTPEQQAIRARALGKHADTLPLSADTPVDVMTARGLLEPDELAAARAYQRAHSLVFGASHARCAALGEARGGEPSPSSLIYARRFLDASRAIVSDLGPRAQKAFVALIIDERHDAATIALRAGKPIHTLGEPALDRLARVRFALHIIAGMPRPTVTSDDLRRDDPGAAQRSNARNLSNASLRDRRPSNPPPDVPRRHPQRPR